MKGNKNYDFEKEKFFSKYYSGRYTSHTSISTILDVCDINKIRKRNFFVTSHAVSPGD